MSFEVIHRGYDPDSRLGHITLSEAVSGRSVTVKVSMPMPARRSGESPATAIERSMLDEAKAVLRDVLDVL